MTASTDKERASLSAFIEMAGREGFDTAHQWYDAKGWVFFSPSTDDCWRYWQAALRAPVVPQGWKLVPIEATQEMVDAWSSATELPEGVAEQADDVVNAYAARRDWKAMLAASPETKACYAATQPAAQGMEARDAAFEAVRKAFCKVQRYSFLLDR